MNLKSFVHVEVTNVTTDFCITPPPPPPRINIGDTNQSNQTREGEPKPVISQPIQGNVEQPRTTEPWSTVQYATVTEPTKRNTVLLHVILVKILSPD